MEYGIYKAISDEKYHNNLDDENTIWFSSHLASTLYSQTPYHAWMNHPKLNPNYKPINKKEFDIGTAAHELMLKKDDNKICVLEYDNFRTNDSKYDKKISYENGIIPILREDYEKINQMVDTGKEFIELSPIAGIFNNGNPEVTILGNAFGADFKSRLDWLTSDMSIIFDYKTSKSANPKKFARDIFNFGYDIQAAAYKEISKCNTYIWFVQEIEYPYLCSIIVLDSVTQEIGRNKLKIACKKWLECLRTKKWPAYGNNIHEIEPKPWDVEEVEQRLLDEGENDEI